MSTIRRLTSFSLLLCVAPVIAAAQQGPTVANVVYRHGKFSAHFDGVSQREAFSKIFERAKISYYFVGTPSERLVYCHLHNQSLSEILSTLCATHPQTVTWTVVNGTYELRPTKGSPPRGIIMVGPDPMPNSLLVPSNEVEAKVTLNPKSGLYDVSAENRDIREVLRAIFKTSGLPYSISPEVVGTISCESKNISFESLLPNILRQVDATYRVEGGVYQVIRKE